MTPYTPEQMREWADSPNSSHSTAAMLRQAATDAEQVEYQRRLMASMEELLRSAHCIAARRGEGTHWDRFAASIQALGIGPVTARTYRVLPSDTEDNLPMADTEPNGVDVWLIKWAISNCHTLARRRIKAGSTDSDWWGHVLRLCEKAGAKSLGVLRAGECDALGQAATDAELARVCVWTPDEDGVWHTTCRNAFVTEDGGTAAQHGFKFCCYCGGTLTEGTAK